MSRATEPFITRLPRADRALVVALLAMLAASAYRAWQVDLALGPYLGCDGCLVGSVLGHDLWLLAALLGMFVLARGLGSRLAAALLGSAAVLMSLAFIVDVFVQRLLSRRLLLPDLVRYGGDVDANLTVLAPLLRQPEGWALALTSVVLVSCAGFAVVGAARSPRTHGLRAWGAVLALAAGLAWYLGQTWYLNRNGYENVLSINRGSGMSREYGQATIARLARTPPPPLSCEAGAARRMSVIVLVVESLSMHHSALFSGLPGQMPGLDAAARAGSWFPDFYSNGFSTEGGLIALLTGATPISSLRFGTVMAFADAQGDFHRELAAGGYTTRFFTTGGLEFGRRDQWLQRIGIREAEGAAHPAYDGLPRGAFHAASDQALFNRFLAWYDGERNGSPFMATVLTVGMHPPYGGGRSDGGEAAVRATDEALGRFVAALDARGFFDENLLFVVGDHRAMTPVQADELRRFGPGAMVRVPAFVRGASGLPPGPVAGEFQQADLIPSLQSLLMQRSCRSPLQGLMFGPRPRTARALLLADPMRYEHVQARVDGNGYLLELDGDDSRWLGPVPDPGFDLALEVARMRIARDRPPPP